MKVCNSEPNERFRTETVKGHFAACSNNQTMNDNAVTTKNKGWFLCYWKRKKERRKINAGYEKIICMVYWLAKEEITMNKFPSLLDLLESVGCEDLSLFETLSSHIVPEIILILANNLRQGIVTQIKK